MANTQLSRECDQAFMELPRDVKFWLNRKSARQKTSNNITIGKLVMSDYREHIEDSKKSIASFSGGKDSTAMVLMMLERGMKLDYILWCDTGEEFPQMYEHINKFDDYIFEHYGKRITRLQSDMSFEYGLADVPRTKGKWAGFNGYGWSNMRIRWCTNMLKVKPVRQFMMAHGFTKGNTKMYIGIAADEPKRVRDQLYPLFEWGITEQEALEYCYRRGFDWGGLYKERTRLSCWLCPMQTRNDLYLLWRDFPDLWKELKRLDNRVKKRSEIAGGVPFWGFKRTHPSDPTIAEYEARFKKRFAKEGGNLFEDNDSIHT